MLLCGSCIDPFGPSALESRVRQLEQSITALKAENAELKESAEIAAHQLALTQGRKMRDEQVETALREQLEELQVQNEHKTNTAMLQQQLLSLQVLSHLNFNFVSLDQITRKHKFYQK